MKNLVMFKPDSIHKDLYAHTYEQVVKETLYVDLHYNDSTSMLIKIEII